MHTAPYVQQADADIIVVSVRDANLQAELTAAGFARQAGAQPGATDFFVRPVRDDAEKADVFNFLRDKGFAWSRGREWCPAEIFERLRDQQLIAGPFKAISWRSPDDWVIRDA